MLVSIIVKAFLGSLIGFYLIFSGWMILKNKKVYIPLNIRLGLWLSGKIYGDRFAEKERAKFIQNQLSLGKQMLIIGLLIVFISLVSVFGT